MPPKRDPRKPAPPSGGASVWGALLLGAVAVGVAAVGYFVGKEDGREEERSERVVVIERDTGESQNGGPVPAAAAASAVTASPSPHSSPSAPALLESKDSTSDATHNSHECSVCLDRHSNTVFMPCRHQTCCKQCALKLQECPICRRKIASKIEVFKS